MAALLLYTLVNISAAAKMGWERNWLRAQNFVSFCVSGRAAAWCKPRDSTRDRQQHSELAELLETVKPTPNPAIPHQRVIF